MRGGGEGRYPPLHTVAKTAGVLHLHHEPYKLLIVLHVRRFFFQIISFSVSSLNEQMNIWPENTHGQTVCFPTQSSDQ